MNGGPISGPMAAPAAVEPSFWRERRVLITGHTGFKGGWLALWLQALGCPVGGLSVGVPTEPSLYVAADVSRAMSHEVLADVRDPAAVGDAVQSFAPDVLFHLAAQPLVRRSYAEPRETYEVNVMGTVNVLDAVRAAPTVRVVVIVTTDKCYENRGWDWGYRENEPIGGHDPYSSSKGAAELVTAAYRSSFFAADSPVRVASARAGNVIGGDCGRGAARPGRCARTVGGACIADPPSGCDPAVAARAQPAERVHGARAAAVVGSAAGERVELRPAGRGRTFGRMGRRAVPGPLGRQPSVGAGGTPQPHEATYLKLDSSRARARLGWRPPVRLERALDSVADWYDAFDRDADMRDFSLAQLSELAGF